MNIAQLEVIALRVDKEDLQALDEEVGGLSQRWLIYSIFIWWALVIAFENRIFSYLLCQRGSKP